MKLNLTGAVLALSVVLLSCDDSDPEPLKTPLVLPVRLELDDYKRELVFDASNRLSEAKTSSFMPGDVVLESTTTYTYAPDGKLMMTTTDSGYRLEFMYANDTIVRTDQYINDEFNQYYTFTYDERGRLHELVSWQDVPEMGGVVPVSKEIYLYDSNDNLTIQFLYVYNSGIQGHELLQSYEYDDYDDQPETESLFDLYVFNPQVKLRRNNPGKMVIRNRHGNTVMVDQYTYVYNAHGYATRKTTTSVFSNSGSGGSYDTRYFYEERR